MWFSPLSDASRALSTPDPDSPRESHVRRLGLWATPLDPEYELDAGEGVVHPAPVDVAAFLADAFPNVEALRVILPIDPFGGDGGRDDAHGWTEVVRMLAASLDPSGERRCVGELMCGKYDANTAFDSLQPDLECGMRAVAQRRWGTSRNTYILVP